MESSPISKLNFRHNKASYISASRVKVEGEDGKEWFILNYSFFSRFKWDSYFYRAAFKLYGFHSKKPKNAQRNLNFQHIFKFLFYFYVNPFRQLPWGKRKVSIKIPSSPLPRSKSRKKILFIYLAPEREDFFNYFNLFTKVHHRVSWTRHIKNLCCGSPYQQKIICI